MLNGTNKINTELNNKMKSREIQTSEKYSKTYINTDRARKAALKLCFMYGVNLRFMVVGCNESPRYRLVFFLNDENEYCYTADIAGAGHQVIA